MPAGAAGLRLRVRGRVQGVGFRPFVWRLAQRFGVTGDVSNDAEGVLIHAAGGDLDGFVAALRTDAPALARVDDITVAPWDGSARTFQIVASGPAGAETGVTPDAATCPECVDEVFAPGRRRGYALTNCTNCGPRFSILTGLPYDRAQTTMAGFVLCPACQAEYDNPADRRFHAQPVACPDCGPRLWFEGGDGAPIRAAAHVLRAGGIVAIKGLGGFHLACDATDTAAVARLRARKHRPGKPLAVMGTLEMVQARADVSAAEAALLADPAAPIVLLRARGGLADGIAPGLDVVGWMLPYTPLHHLLLAEVGRPLVMTSGNRSGAPQVIDNDTARADLDGIADGFLMHDRAIARRLDDSVERADPPMVLRRARGRVPGTLPLPPGFQAAPQVVAYGGQMKGALCLIKNGQALLGHHLGDLDDALTVQAFHQADADYRALFDHAPQIAACDLHPDFRASVHARASGLPVAEVQHHHAHLAACLGENRWPLDGGPVAGIVLDGLGLGPDGTVWGGEVLLGDYRGFQRHAWLRPAPLPGGDAAQRDPWRNLLVRLDQAGLDGLADTLLADRPVALLRRAVAGGLNAPLSSSAGRLFDAVAAALGLAPVQSYEGEAAMLLEALARRSGGAAPYPLPAADGVLDPVPMMQALATDLAAGRAPADIALAFHRGLAQGFATVARGLVDSGAARAVALTGGCFQNALLLQLSLQALQSVPVLTHRETPANDGGLALGQALVAAARALDAK